MSKGQRRLSAPAKTLDTGHEGNGRGGQRHGARNVRRAVRRGVRAFALGGRTRLGAASVPRPRRAPCGDDGVRARGRSDEQMALIRAHPDLVGRAAREGRLGAASASEQAGAGLDRLDAGAGRVVRGAQPRLPGTFRLSRSSSACERTGGRPSSTASRPGCTIRPTRKKPPRWARSKKSRRSGWRTWLNKSPGGGQSSTIFTLATPESSSV